MKKADLRILTAELMESYHANRPAFYTMLDERLLQQRISFPHLEFVGAECYRELGPEAALELAEWLVERNAMGGYVIAAMVLQLHLPVDRPLSWERCADYMVRGNEWYTCDILAERVFGQSLLQAFEPTVANLEQCQQHPNDWVQRSVGVAVHLAAKRAIDTTQARRLMDLCMKQATSKSFHVKKGCGWGIETIAKFFPEVAEDYRVAILDDPRVNAWNKWKLKMGFEKGAKRSRPVLDSARTRPNLGASKQSTTRGSKRANQAVASHTNPQRPGLSPEKIGKDRPELQARADIEQLVDAFYTQAITDPVLGPVFEAAQLDLAAHKPIIVDFWETSIFNANSYQRNAMQVHVDLNATVPLKGEHFERWLALWERTVDAMFTGQHAHNAKIRARSIGTIMQVKIRQSEQ